MSFRFRASTTVWCILGMGIAPHALAQLDGGVPDAAVIDDASVAPSIESDAAVETPDAALEPVPEAPDESDGASIVALEPGTDEHTGIRGRIVDGLSGEGLAD